MPCEDLLGKFSYSDLDIFVMLVSVSPSELLNTTSNISDASEMNQDGERFIKSTFSVTSKAYLLPEYLNSIITNKVSNMKKFTTPSRVTFTQEGDATDEQVGK